MAISRLKPLPQHIPPDKSVRFSAPRREARSTTHPIPQQAKQGTAGGWGLAVDLFHLRVLDQFAGPGEGVFVRGLLHA